MTSTEPAPDDRVPDDGFDEFFFGLLPRVLRVSQRLTGSRQAAEDISAEAFARAFARWSKVSALPYREAWVMRVATNLAIDAARRRMSRPADDEQDVLDFADMVALRTTLIKALSSLSRAQRDAVALRYLADLPEEDVAIALQIRPGTVKSHLHRATTNLRHKIGTDLRDLGYDKPAV